MIIAEQYIYSHLVKYYPWFSKGVNKEMLEKLTACKPQFNVDNARAGEEGYYQIPLNDDLVALGHVEIVFDERLCTHEHIIILKASDYRTVIGNPKALRDYFINYQNFREQRYSVEDVLSPKEIAINHQENQPQVSVIRKYINNTSDLKKVLVSLYSTAMVPSQKTVLEVGSYTQAMELIDSLFTLLPAEFQENIAFMAGIYPEIVKPFNLLVGIRAVAQPPLIDGISKINTRFPESIAQAASSGDATLVLKHHGDFSRIRGLLGCFVEKQELNTKALEVFPEIERIRDIYFNKMNSIISTKDFLEAWKFAGKAPQVISNEDSISSAKRYVYKKYLEKSQEMVKKGGYDRSKAKNILKSIKEQMGDTRDLTELGNQIDLLEKEEDFTRYALKGEIEEALKILPFEKSLAQLESLSADNKISQTVLNKFFAERELAFDNHVDPNIHYQLWCEFIIFKQQKLLTSLTADSLKENPHLVDDILDMENKLKTRAKGRGFKDEIEINSHELPLKTSTSQGSIKKGSEPKGALPQLELAINNISQQFNAELEMSLLKNPPTQNQSLFIILPDTIFSLKNMIGDNIYNSLMQNYLRKLDSLLPRKNFLNKYKCPFDIKDLQRVYVDLLRPKLYKLISLNQPYPNQLKEIERILVPVIRTDGTYQVTQPPNSEKQEISGETVSLEKSKDEHNLEIEKNEILEGQISEEHKKFWEELRKDPTYLQRKDSGPSGGSFCHSPNYRILEDMKFSPHEEMKLLISCSKQKESLFTIILKSEYTLKSEYLFSFIKPRVNPQMFTNIVRRYLSQLINGMVKEPKEIDQNGEKIEYYFSPADLYRAYVAYLEGPITGLMHLCDPDDLKFSQTCNRLRIIIGDLARQAEKEEKR